MATRVISAEELAKFAQYELPDVDGRRPGGRPPTVAELQKLQDDAYQEAREEGLKKGYDEGFAAGKRDGLAEGRHVIQQQGQQIVQLIQSLAQPFADLDDQVEQQLVHMAMLFAQQIIRREIRTQPGEVVAVVREALALLPVSARYVNVHVHPDDATLLREATAAQDKSWKIVEEPLLARGGCRVVTESSFIDATLEKRLSHLAIQVLGDERAGARMLQTVTDVETETMVRAEAEAAAAAALAIQTAEKNRLLSEQAALVEREKIELQAELPVADALESSETETVNQVASDTDELELETTQLPDLPKRRSDDADSETE